MKAPAGLVGAALLLWGVSIQMAWLGGLAGLAFEGLRLAAAAPWARAPALVAPAMRVCALLALAFLGYAVATQSLPHSLYSWLRWLPVILLPLPVLQLLAQRIPLSSLARGVRSDGGAPAGDRDVDFTHGYAAASLAAAGTGSGAQPWLYLAFAAIVGWALIARAPASRRAAAAALLAAAAPLGYGIHVGLAALQDRVDEWSSELIADMNLAKPDPFRERTRIGDLGRIKLSDRIVMRVAVEGPRPAALLLRESAFDRYRSGEWHGVRRAARMAPRQGERWIVSEGPAGSRLTLRRSLPGGEGLLPLPPATRSVGPLAAQSVEVFPTGAVRVRGTPRFLSMDVAYDESGESEAPTPADLEVPEVLVPVMSRVLDAQELRRGAGAETVAALRAFFRAKFAYSLELGDRGGAAAGRTLGEFLLRDRKGHCEYFATATVLLLRQAGIPARYVGGFSVQEYSALEGAFVVRARHAHAWTTAYVDGRWMDVDTTPSRWAEFEEEAARGLMGPVWDRLSWVADRLLHAWLAAPIESLAAYAAGLVGLALLAAVALRLARRWRARRRAAPVAHDAIAAAWRSVEARLARYGHTRARGETVRQWAERLGREDGAQRWRAALARVSRLYYRARFDPAATAAAREEFAAAAREWMLAPLNEPATAGTYSGPAADRPGTSRRGR